MKTFYKKNSKYRIPLVNTAQEQMQDRIRAALVNRKCSHMIVNHKHYIRKLAYIWKYSQRRRCVANDNYGRASWIEFEKMQHSRRKKHDEAATHWRWSRRLRRYW